MKVVDASEHFFGLSRGYGSSQNTAISLVIEFFLGGHEVFKLFMEEVEDGCESCFMIRTCQSYLSMISAGTSSVAVARKVLLMILTPMSLSGTSIFE